MAKRVYITEFDANGKPYFRTLDQMEEKTYKASKKIDESFKKIGAGIASYFGARELLTFANDAIQLGTKLAGVEKGFNRLKGAESILMRLRKATQGTVTDLQLMQSAVKADNFKIPLDILAKGLEFANKRAIQTGESVDYMVDSFITGVARKSIPILDNLGISQLELNKEVEKTGDFYTAIGNIVERENIKMAGMIDGTVTAQQRLNTQLENTKTQLGKNVLPYWGSFLGILNQIVSNFGNINTFMTGGGFMLAVNNTAAMNSMYGGSSGNKLTPYNYNSLVSAGSNSLDSAFSSFMTTGGIESRIKFLESQRSGLVPGTPEYEANKKRIAELRGMIGQGGKSGKKDDTAWQYYLSNLVAIDQPDANAKGLMRNVYTPPWVGEMNETIVPELQDKFEVIGDSFVNKFGELNNIAHSFSSVLGIGADTFVGKIISGIDTASQILGIISGIINISSGGVTSLFGLAEGGTVINKHGKLSYVPIPKFASGGSYVVPPGYSNDSGLIRVQSGERVDVTPSSQVPILSKTLNEIKSAILAGNMNSARKGKQPVVVNVMLDGVNVTKSNLRNQNRLTSAGQNFGDYD